MNEATRIAQRILDEQGYLVVAYEDNLCHAPEIGRVWRDFIYFIHEGVAGPFFVTSQATPQEYILQSERYALNQSVTARIAAEAIAFFRVTAE